MKCPWCDEEVIINSSSGELQKYILCVYDDIGRNTVCAEIAEWKVGGMNLCLGHMSTVITRMGKDTSLEVSRL